MLIRRLARPLLAAIFIKGGVDTLLNPEPRVQKATPLLEKAAPSLPDQVPSEPHQLVKIDAGVKIGAGVLLAVNKFPRLASLALAGTLVPTTVAGHPFWEKSDPAEKAADQQQFLKNLSILGKFWWFAGLRPMAGLTLERGTGPRLAYAVPVFVGTVMTIWLR